MKKLLIPILLLSFLFLSSTTFAYPIPEAYKFKFTNWEMVSLPNVQWDPNGSQVQTFANLNDGVEDNWAIAKVTSIQDRAQPGVPTVWSEGDNGEELSIMIWGLDVAQVIMADLKFNDNVPDTFNLGLVAVPDGAWMSLWLDDADWGTYTAFDETAGPSARLGAGSYPTVTDGQLQALFQFAPGIDYVPILTDVSQDAFTIPTTGDGAGYLDVINPSGQRGSVFDTDGFVTPFGLRDVFVEFNFRPHPDTGQTDYGWDLNSEDPAIGNAIPEPATMLLLGIGLLGLAGLGRKKFFKKD